MSAGKDTSDRPFLKWVGGKRSLIEQFVPHLPRRFGRYHEPFMGSAALFFHLSPDTAYLSDNNERLVRTYKGLQKKPEEVIRHLSSYRYDRDFYLEMRRRPIDEAPDAELAAWFIYLNKTGYNGLYRVNSKNEFNVPFGKYKSPNFCNVDRLMACSRRLKGVKLDHGDFASVTKRARAGDLVYFDPPYVPLSATSSFTSYTKHGFDIDDQTRLRDVALELVDAGVTVLVSNSASPVVRELYRARVFRHVEIWARRSINSKKKGRNAISELLIKGNPHG